jgi:hypothetical protein
MAVRDTSSVRELALARRRGEYRIELVSEAFDLTVPKATKPAAETTNGRPPSASAAAVARSSATAAIPAIAPATTESIGTSPE